MWKPESPFVIPVFIPHSGCPHQCVFCNQVSITGVSAGIPSSETIHKEIKQFLSYQHKHRQMIQIAFFGGNFLGLCPGDIKRLLTDATRYVISGQADNIRFSTRPDTITRDNLDLIKPFPVTTIEIGAQSMDDRVLGMSKRGHTAMDTTQAAMRLKENRYETGIQMMTGLPGDTEKMTMESAIKIAALEPDFVRIYPTVVIAKSPLAVSYKKNEYTPLSLEESIALVKKLYLYFGKYQIRVIRMGLQADKDLEKESSILAGPYHPAFGQLVFSAIFLDMISELFEKNPEILSEGGLEIHVHPKHISTMRGQHNCNINHLKRTCPFSSYAVLPDMSLASDEIRVGNNRIRMSTFIKTILN
ncbi:MAG: radical SAM protein [Proteobacteria bacterium]|nr:radical SAM protein [Pseudomonadota bacterium]